MTSYMGRDIWHLYLINLVVPAHHTVKSVFPVHGNQRHSVLIQKKKSCVSSYHFLHFIFWSVLNDCSKHICNFFCHWNYPCSGIRLCRLNHILHLRSSLQLIPTLVLRYLSTNSFTVIFFPNGSNRLSRSYPICFSSSLSERHGFFPTGSGSVGSNLQL